jgi:hypothetical protein
MKLVLFSLLFVVLNSCKQEMIPKDILGQDKMANVLWDVIRADELLHYIPVSDSVVNQQFSNIDLSKYSKEVVLYQKAFDAHNITADQFKNSFSYYQNRPHLLKVVLDSLRSISNRNKPLP